MTGTTFPTIGSGWRAAVNWSPEAVYGEAPTNLAYTWVGAVQSFEGDVDKQPILVYRMDGSTDFPAYILKGQRNVTFTITFWPQDINLLTYCINYVGTSSAASLSFIIKDYDTGETWTVTGCVANKITVNGKTGTPLSVEVDFNAQNILRGGLPTGATFSSDTGVVPFFFSQETVYFNNSTPQPQTLTFQGTITNNLSVVPQFGTDIIRSIVSLTRVAEGQVTATFASLADYYNEGNIPWYTQYPYTDMETDPTGLSPQTIVLLLGVNGDTNFYLTFSNAKLPEIDLTYPIADLVGVQLPWTAQAVTVQT